MTNLTHLLKWIWQLNVTILKFCQSNYKGMHCVKIVHIRSYSGPHFSRIFPHADWIRYLSIFCPNSGKCGKNADQNNSEYGHLFTQWWWNLVYCDYFISDDTTFKQNHVLLIAVCESLSKIVRFYIASFNWYDLILG